MQLGKKAYSLMLMLVLSVVSGLVAAGLIVPGLAVLTTASAAAASFVSDFPEAMEPWDPALKTTIKNSDGTLLAEIYDENRIYKPLSEIADIMIKAQVAIEDHRFYEHGAIDVSGTLRALVSTAQGTTQGGSSITQQYVRSALVLNAKAKNDTQAQLEATEDTLARKVRELSYAVSVEKEMTKDEILEAYLNISYYGGGAYGVEAAAKRWFSVSAAELTLPQAALLAGMVRNPYATDPEQFEGYATERRNNVLDRLADPEVGVITQAEADAAKAEPLGIKATIPTNGCVSSKYPFLCYMAYDELINNGSTQLGSTKEERERRLRRGGLEVITDFDKKSQDAAQKELKSGSKKIAAKDEAIGLIGFIEPGTGRVIAMAQSRPKIGNNCKTDDTGSCILNEEGKETKKWKGETYYNYFMTEDMRGADGFHGGSTFKMFTTATALAEGYGAGVTVSAKDPTQYKGKTFYNPDECGGPFKLNGSWEVFDGGGTRNLYSGVQNSANNFFATLIQSVGTCNVVKMAETLGLRLADTSRELSYYYTMPSFTLGAVEMAPISLMEAYATVASGGIHCTAVMVKTINDTVNGGEIPPRDGSNCEEKPVISEELANSISAVMRKSVEGGTSRQLWTSGIQIAGKTGTVPGNRSVLQVGYTPQIVGLSLISYDNNERFEKFWKNTSSYLRYVTLTSSGTTLQGSSADDTGTMLAHVFVPTLKRVTGGNYKNFGAPDQSILAG
ncbi:MAG: penicillin-binding protein, partial [Propionibacteriaceae bacterium]|nr:penicillin-binding protein [Propionibacteriaceae bacterium]